jgi:hypothetical protein|nr:MAG TPA_asm: hypothetical protein [Caudoviricetes sp.]
MTRTIVTTTALCKVLNKKEEKIEELEVILVGSFQKEERKELALTKKIEEMGYIFISKISETKTESVYTMSDSEFIKHAKNVGKEEKEESEE